MQEEKYLFKRLLEEYFYEFFSEGPRGKIKKKVRYRLISESPNKIYNLGFGDWDETMELINDSITTNNNDRQKVLATVAGTLLDFTKNKPEISIFAQGSTPSRTRLYQMGISSFWIEICLLFSVLDYKDDTWQSFEKGKNYDAFMIKLNN